MAVSLSPPPLEDRESEKSAEPRMGDIWCNKLCKRIGCSSCLEYGSSFSVTSGAIV